MIQKLLRLSDGKLREIPFSEFAKAMQQTKATNLIPKTPKNINYISEELGLPDRLSEDMPMDELDVILGTNDSMQSRSGDGLAAGQNNGTSTKRIN